MLLNIDNFLVVGFLILTFVVGIGHSRGIKNIKDYALGGRNFPTGAIVATLVATWISGSGFVTTLSQTYSDGLYYFIASISMALSFVITAVIFVPRMGEFLGHNSIAESMGSIYGRNVRIITAITGIIASIGFIAVQFKVFGSLFTYFLGLPATEAILIAALLVTTYSALGGIKSVTFTDVVQIFTFCLAIPIIGIMIWNQIYYDGVSFERSLSSGKFNFFEVVNLGNPKFIEMIPLFLYFALPGLKPAFCQRILIGNNLQQVKKAFIIAACLVFLIEI